MPESSHAALCLEGQPSEGQSVGVEALDDFLSRERRFAVAFSGGCDSACLLAAAHLAGREVKAYLVKTAFQAAFELDDARAVIGRLGVPFEVIELDVFAGGEDERAVCANPPDRCYLCKRLIFSTVWEHARRDGFEVLVDGTNASDDPARRPSFRALAELGVVSPLRRAGMTKDAVRARLAASEQAFKCVAKFRGDEECLELVEASDDELAEERIASTTRLKNFQFSMVGIPVGSEIAFIKDESITATVENDKNLISYNGQTTTMSSLAAYLMGKPGRQYHGPKFFTYEGEALSDRRARMEAESEAGQK